MSIRARLLIYDGDPAWIEHLKDKEWVRDVRIVVHGSIRNIELTLDELALLSRVNEKEVG